MKRKNLNRSDIKCKSFIPCPVLNKVLSRLVSEKYIDVENIDEARKAFFSWFELYKDTIISEKLVSINLLNVGIIFPEVKRISKDIKKMEQGTLYRNKDNKFFVEKIGMLHEAKYLTEIAKFNYNKHLKINKTVDEEYRAETIEEGIRRDLVKGSGARSKRTINYQLYGDSTKRWYSKDLLL